MYRYTIPPAELQFTFVRSSGPGGQNVNKVNTKAVLRWAVKSRRSIPERYGSPQLGPISSGLGEVFHFEVKGQKPLMELRTILEGVAVLSVNPQPEPSSQGQNLPAVTLLTNPADADVLALADSGARVRLALRNPLDNATRSRTSNSVRPSSSPATRRPRSRTSHARSNSTRSSGWRSSGGPRHTSPSATRSSRRSTFSELFVLPLMLIRST